MKKSVIVISAFVMVMSVIALIVGASAAWFSNISQGTGSIVIDSGTTTGYVTITAGTSPANKLSPAKYNEGYFFNNGKVSGVLDNANLGADKAFKSLANEVSYGFQFIFSGSPNAADGKRNIEISVEAICLENPKNEQGKIKNPLPTSYVEYVGYNLTCVGASSNNVNLNVATPIEQNVNVNVGLYFKVADEELPIELVDKTFYILVRVRAVE